MQVYYLILFEEIIFLDKDAAMNKKVVLLLSGKIIEENNQLQEVIIYHDILDKNIDLNLWNVESIPCN